MDEKIIKEATQSAAGKIELCFMIPLVAVESEVDESDDIACDELTLIIDETVRSLRLCFVQARIDSSPGYCLFVGEYASI